jgi:hypothetical protein
MIFDAFDLPRLAHNHFIVLITAEIANLIGPIRHERPHRFKRGDRNLCSKLNHTEGKSSDELQILALRRILSNQFGSSGGHLKREGQVSLGRIEVEFDDAFRFLVAVQLLAHSPFPLHHLDQVKLKIGERFATTRR